MENNQFSTAWKMYESLLKALVELLHPFIEVAVHDLEEGRLVAIYHNISQRKIGDVSPLKDLKVETKDFPDYFKPYYKQNFDGRPLKCTSITVRDKKGKAIGLICINVDTSVMQDAHNLLERFLETKDEAANPIELFGVSCEKQAMLVIQQYLDENHLALDFLNRDQKKELVQILYRKGVFNYKNAAPFIAKKLNTSRASIYNYIKQI